MLHRFFPPKKKKKKIKPAKEKTVQSNFGQNEIRINTRSVPSATVNAIQQ